MISTKIQSKLKNKIYNKFIEVFSSGEFEKNLSTNTKRDKTIVTEIDLYISSLIKSAFNDIPSLKGYTFYSEEEFGEYKFPAIILDPIDGTKELSQGIPECAMSLAIMEGPNFNEDQSWGWIFNPFTGFELTSDDLFSNPIAYRSSKRIFGLVSSTEYNRELYGDISKSDDVVVSPMGSIAFKLGLLAAGACDFVITRRPKNVWDIAAGTLLCSKRNIHFYAQGVKMDNLNEVHYKENLFWCRDEIKKTLDNL